MLNDAFEKRIPLVTDKPSKATSFDGRNFSQNAPPEFIHKGGGVGWGSGNLIQCVAIRGERMELLWKRFNMSM